MNIKITASVLITPFLTFSSIYAQFDNGRDFKELKEKRNKALAAAAVPINREYAKSLEVLLRRASQALQPELAIEIKKEIQSISDQAAPATPTALFGSWHNTRMPANIGNFVINENKTALMDGGLRGAWSIKNDFLIIRWDNGVCYRIPISETGNTLKMEEGNNDSNQKWTPAPAARR